MNIYEYKQQTKRLNLYKVYNALNFEIFLLRRIKQNTILDYIQ